MQKIKRKKALQDYMNCRDITIIDFYLITTLLRKDYEKSKL